MRDPRCPSCSCQAQLTNAYGYPTTAIDDPCGQDGCVTGGFPEIGIWRGSEEDVYNPTDGITQLAQNPLDDNFCSSTRIKIEDINISESSKTICTHRRKFITDTNKRLVFVRIAPPRGAVAGFECISPLS